MILIFKPHFAYFGYLCLYPLREYPNLLLFIVIIAVPIVFNSLQLWLVDEFLMYRKNINQLNGEFNYSKLPYPHESDANSDY